MASKFIIELMKKAGQKLAGQGKTTGKEGIKFIKPSVGKLDKIQKGKKRITDITDKYAVGFGKNNPELLKKFRKGSKKNLDSISKIYKGKKDGGRMGLKSGSKFPDHSGDGKITQKDILMAKGVIPKTKSKKKVI
jgi:hypothetical protein